MEATHNLDFPTPSSGSASQAGVAGVSQEVTGLAGGSPGVLSRCVDAQSPGAKSSGASRLTVCPNSCARFTSQYRGESPWPQHDSVPGPWRTKSRLLLP